MAEVETVYSVVDGDGHALAGVKVDVRAEDDADAPLVASGTTGDAGTVTFYLEDGTTYYLWRRKAGYNFTNPDTEIAGEGDWEGTGTAAAGVEAAANALVDLDEAKDWLKLTGADDDDFLQRAINDWSDAIETCCNRVFKSAEYTDEVHDGGKLSILLRNFPVTEVTSITIDGAALGTDDYTTDLASGIIRPAYGKRFSGGKGSVLVTYTGGYETIPGDIKRAVKQLVALEYYLSGHGRKALAKRGESAPGGGSVTYERGPEDQVRIIDRIARRYGRR